MKSTGLVKMLAMVVGACALAACGGLEEEDAALGKDHADVSQKARYSYTCYPFGAYARSMQLPSFRLAVSGNHATYTGQPGDATATRDPAYHPRKDLDRYKYVWQGHAPGPWQSPYILFQKSLLTGGAVLSDGKKGGFGGVYFHDDSGGGTSNFVCKW